MRNRGVKLLAGLAGVVGAIRAVRRRPRGLSELSGQVALVTGGSRGLGLLLARELAARGCKVAICARDGAALERARRDLVARGATVHAEACDVADRAQIERLVANVRQALGPVDVLVNNAGILQVGPLETMALEDFQRAMATLFWSAVYAVHAVLPAMRARRHGRIVNITSIGGKLSIPHLVPYGCAKFALVGLSEGLRAELARDGILVTTVVPGLMRTGSPANVLYKGQADLEYSWFSLGAALPLSSMDAARAA
ncbi:MAG: SDR family oxidoreductase, partial [Deltaproteobacteria bacterium]|nr:SDR family oxidoreductase [Deltaproteobacteria bacterium]